MSRQKKSEFKKLSRLAVHLLLVLHSLHRLLVRHLLVDAGHKTGILNANPLQGGIAFSVNHSWCLIIQPLM